ncbi:hypothetical protein XELAEV_18023361mg [Xenopus laevis]|uniref:Uncharacterized protein n=1 Tax=Xenopus laevis TaxID=8355 RepID=A0A974D6P0_XENLA|nr:hypothetical protein XELAEV_18023361mg [Xenopus laevis]
MCRGYTSAHKLILIFQYTNTQRSSFMAIYTLTCSGLGTIHTYAFLNRTQIRTLTDAVMPQQGNYYLASY